MPSPGGMSPEARAAEFDRLSTLVQAEEALGLDCTATLQALIALDGGSLPPLPPGQWRVSEVWLWGQPPDAYGAVGDEA